MLNMDCCLHKAHDNKIIKYNFKNNDTHNLDLDSKYDKLIPHKCPKCEFLLSSKDYIHCCEHNVIYTKNTCCFICNNVPQLKYNTIYNMSGGLLGFCNMSSCNMCGKLLGSGSYNHCCEHKVVMLGPCGLCFMEENNNNMNRKINNNKLDLSISNELLSSLLKTLKTISTL